VHSNSPAAVEADFVFVCFGFVHIDPVVGWCRSRPGLVVLAVGVERRLPAGLVVPAAQWPWHWRWPRRGCTPAAAEPAAAERVGPAPPWLVGVERCTSIVAERCTHLMKACCKK